MTLPAPSADLNPRDDFKFQTVLSLQHLFRIGIAMSVSWFTGTVAYLSSSQNPSNAAFPTVQRAKIAGQAWKMTHSRPDPLDNNNDEQPRDLWEEKYYAGMITMGGVADTKSLPDWEVVSLGDGNEKEGIVPSFWAAEVEELPRGADIEWAALTGVVGGPVQVCSDPDPLAQNYLSIQVDYKTKNGSWTVQQTRFGNLVQSVVKVLSGNDDAIDQRAGEALLHVGLEADSGPVASWLDCSVEDTRRAWEDTKFGGLVPCRSLWDADGVRLAAVFVFETEAPSTVAENT
jgi:diphthine-ammonia ligase